MSDVVPTRRAGTAQRPREPRVAARLPHVDPDRCTGCGRCVSACDAHLLSLEVVRWKKTSVLNDAERCTGCTLCAVKCPFHAITMKPTKR